MSKKWQQLFDQASEGVVMWRGEEQKATLATIEEKVDRSLSRVRAQMIQDLALSSPNQNIKELEKEKRPRCERCDIPLSSKGMKRRQLLTEYEEVVELERSQASCSQCGATLFPPR